MRRRLGPTLVGASIIAMSIWVSAAVVRAEQDGTAPKRFITMNFQNVELPVLAKFISEITGKNFILDESVRGKVSIISPSKVTPDQAYRIFQSVLQLKGYATVPVGKVIKIVPATLVRQSAALTQSQEPALAQGDQYVTRMVKLRNAEAATLVGVIQPMVSRNGLVVAYPQGNTLILTDDAYNVERLLRIIGSLDVQGLQQNFKVIPLKYAFADQLAPEIGQILGISEQTTGGPQRPIVPRPMQGVVAPAATGPSGGFRVIPDERTNSLVVLAPPIQMRHIEDIIAKLDVESPAETSRIHVYHLKNAQAAEIVQVLNGLLGGGTGISGLAPQTGIGSLGRGSSMGLFSGSYNPGLGGASGAMGGLSSTMGGMSASGFGGFGGGMMSSGIGGMGAMGMGSRNSAALAAGATAATTGKTAEFSNPVSVTADPATNSLVISALPQDYVTLRKIISELDVPRVQVFVQAIIVEISADFERDLGINFTSATALSGSTLGIGQLNFGQLQNALGNPLGLTGLGLGLASGSTCSVPTAVASTVASGVTAGTSGTITVPCDIALMTALETDQHANVLSAPTLLTADNEEAMIVVGENLPFVGSAAANAGLPGQIFNSVDRQNVGITLDIVPQVSQGGYVKLDLYEEVSNVLNNTINNPLGPTTTIRAASTTVLVQNNRTAVVGGLMSTEEQNQLQGVPWVSHIPVLGNLFSNTQRTTQKDNLLVFLTPHIIMNENDLRALSLDQRWKFIEGIGAREMHRMPMSQVRELYKPSFSVPVSPQQDLNARYGAVLGGGNHLNAPPAGSSTPLNTRVINPATP
jgi:general secretion pathway protein D